MNTRRVGFGVVVLLLIAVLGVQAWMMTQGYVVWKKQAGWLTVASIDGMKIEVYDLGREKRGASGYTISVGGDLVYMRVDRDEDPETYEIAHFESGELMYVTYYKGNKIASRNYYVYDQDGCRVYQDDGGTGVFEHCVDRASVRP